MAGPACEVLLVNDDDSTLLALDAIPAGAAESIRRTRKGRVWDIRVRGHPIHVLVAGGIVEMSAGLNDAEDYAILYELSGAIVAALGGIASDPEK